MKPQRDSQRGISLEMRNRQWIIKGVEAEGGCQKDVDPNFNLSRLIGQKLRCCCFRGGNLAQALEDEPA